MAAVLANEIYGTLANIAKSRQGLSDGKVNIWRLPKMLGLTRVTMGVEGDLLKERLIADKVEDEEDGIWDDIALLVLNLVALLLAGPTGGLSLVVAGAVNATVAYVHIQEYILQDALAHSAFGAAQALSQDEPSLFWLAVEIIGVGLDLGSAAAALRSAFKALAPVAKGALAAEAGAELELNLVRVHDIAETVYEGSTHGARAASKADDLVS